MPSGGDRGCICNLVEADLTRGGRTARPDPRDTGHRDVAGEGVTTIIRLTPVSFLANAGSEGVNGD
jgi:hypothetical protein